MICKIDVTTHNKKLINQFHVTQDISAPVWCFSLIGPAHIVVGGKKLSQTGGYFEVLLPDLIPDTIHHVVIAYPPETKGINRAWHPMGNYFRLDSTIYEIECTTPIGVHAKHRSAELSLCKNEIIPAPKQTNFTEASVSKPLRATGIAGLNGVKGLAQRLGIFLFHDDACAIPIRHEISPIGPEAYHITITQNRITITAQDSSGVHNAGITLLNLMRNHGQLPIGTIQDYPQFKWRGQHLDCARHFFSKEFIFLFLDKLALLKLNKFHWHFADDETFRLRLESLKNFADLSIRGEGHLIPAVFGAGPMARGHYTKTDVREIIERARTFNIDIIPEFELPAHSLALCRVLPEVRDVNDLGREVSVQGYTKNVMNPAKQETWCLIDSIVGELTALFPSEILHIGGDELPENAWSCSPLVAQLKDKEGLYTVGDVLGWTMQKAGQIVRKHGRRPAAWQEAARGINGGIQNDAIIFGWSGIGDCINAAEREHDIVLCPAQHCYFDMAHTHEIDDWGASWANPISIKDIQSWDPLADIDPTLHKNVLGIQGAFWSEFTSSDQDAMHMIFPRLDALSCIAWGKEKQKQ